MTPTERAREERPCPRCGRPAHRIPNCKVRRFRVGTRVRQIVGTERTGTILEKPKWLRREMSVYVEWDDDGYKPTENAVNPGWIETINNKTCPMCQGVGYIQKERNEFMTHGGTCERCGGDGSI